MPNAKAALADYLGYVGHKLGLDLLEFLAFDFRFSTCETNEPTFAPIDVAQRDLGHILIFHEVRRQPPFGCFPQNSTDFIGEVWVEYVVF